MRTRKATPVLTWPGKDDPPPVGAATLVDDAALAHGDPVSPNRLVRGDNLAALHALLPDHAGAVRLAYLDPPYNTGAALEHYDDDAEHAGWLAAMRDRLAAVRRLLRPDGIVVVQIGFDEMAYLKVLMDELFGRSRCIGQVAVRMSHSAGMKRLARDRRLVKNTEYLLVYFNDEAPTLQPLYEPVAEFPVNYFHWVEEVPSAGAPGRFVPLADEVERRFAPLLRKHGLRATNRALTVLFEREQPFRRFLVEHADRVARKDANVPRRVPVPEGLAADTFVEVPGDGRSYWMGTGWQLYTLADKVHGEAVANLLGDWWDGFWRDMSRVDREGGVLMKESKKPERLLQRILELTTLPGDLVLDPFVGSGTTAAVAHKMGRRWIGVDAGAHVEDLAVPRLRRVVDGTDPTGVTEATGWKGGGGFRFARVHEE